MKKIRIDMLIAGAALTALLFFVGCAGIESPANALFAIKVKHGDSVGDGGSDSKTGRACAQTILVLIATGDASIETAKSNGGIRKVAYVDHESSGYSSFYGEYCTIVKGS